MADGRDAPGDQSPGLRQSETVPRHSGFAARGEARQLAGVARKHHVGVLPTKVCKTPRDLPQTGYRVLGRLCCKQLSHALAAALQYLAAEVESHSLRSQ
jgi:hypothetical protein